MQQIIKTVSMFGCCNSARIDIKKFSADASVDLKADPEELEFLTKKKEMVIESKRDVSRLNPEDKNRVHGKVPYPEPKAHFHLKVKYRRKMYGLHGHESGVNPGIMWPTKEEIKERKEYESVAFPFTIQEMVQAEVSKRQAEEDELMHRQMKIQQNVAKLNQWMKDLENKRAKKIELITAAKAKKDRLTEEVRRHFGYTVDPRDERFQQMLEQKEKEERKQAKLERKKRVDERMTQDLMAAASKVGNKTDNE